MARRPTARCSGNRWWPRAAHGAVLLLAGMAGAAAAQSVAPAPAPQSAVAAVSSGADDGDSTALTGPERDSPRLADAPVADAGDRAAPLRVAPASTTAPTEALAQAVLTVDQEAIYRQSRWGLRAQAEIAAQSRQVAADNEKAFAALVADEDALTAARAKLSAVEFRRRATAFDERVTAVRKERDAARAALSATADRDRALFFRSAAPVLGRIMEARGALVVLDQRTVLISDERIDVTAATIAAVDAALGDGRAVIDAALAAERAAAEERGAGAGPGAEGEAMADTATDGAGIGAGASAPENAALRTEAPSLSGSTVQAGETVQPEAKPVQPVAPTSAPDADASSKAPLPRPQEAKP